MSASKRIAWIGPLVVARLLVAAEVGVAEDDTSSWLQVPPVDVRALEEPVARQLEELRALVTARVQDPEATAVELAGAFGELCRHYHAYQLLEPAEECYTIARRLAPNDFRWSYLAAYLYQSGGRLEEAVRHYERALQIVPEVPPLLIRLGRAYRDLGRSEQAERVLLDAYRLDPSAAAALSELGQLYLSSGRNAEAVEVLEKALELEPGADRLYYPLGQAYRALGEMERAREALGRSGEVGVRPADPLVDGLARLTTGERIHLLRGRAAFEAGQYGEAAAEFRKAVEARPDSARARINLASALSESGETERAIAELEEAVRLAPGNATALFNLGVLHERLGAFERAAERFGEAVAYERSDAEMRLRLADALRRLGRPEEALPHYSRAVALEPGLESGWLAEAETLARLGRFEEAITRLETAYKLMPTSGQVAHGLARLLAACPDLSLRDGARAVDLALRVVKARPTLLHVQTVAAAYAESGRCDEAAAWQGRAVEAVREEGTPRQLEVLSAVLESYQAGPPCRPPVATRSAP